ncbi:MAG: hypothetical protein JNJ63_11740 [Hyphomonadaceae bacterium]|nr:hypothetical protein [Hyphomonadaceae bacterium]
MDNNPFDDLPDDPDDAFVAVERRQRDLYEKCREMADNCNQVKGAQLEYMTAVHAAASVCEIPTLTEYELRCTDDDNFDYNFQRFYLAANRIVLEIQMTRAKRTRRYSVELDADAKTRIHSLIGNIRQVVEAASDLEERKRTGLLEKLNAFAAEVDRARLRLDIWMDTVLTVSATVGKAAKNLMPLGRFVSEITDIVAVAKEKFEMQALPSKPERVRITHQPKKAKKVVNGQRETFSADLDDEIPF